MDDEFDKGIQQVMDNLDQIAANMTILKNKVNKAISEYDIKLVDLYHFIEFGKYDAVDGWTILKAIKDILFKRREAKNLLPVTDYVESNISKISKKANNIYKQSKQRKYRVRTDILQKTGLHTSYKIVNRTPNKK